MSRIALAALLVLAASSASGTPVLSLDEWGLYSASQDRRVAEPNATSGHSTMSRDVRLIERTHQICAQLGTHFGIRFSIRKDVPANALNVAVDVAHPPMMNTHGALQTRDQMARQVKARESAYSGWIFSDPRELIPGKWHIIVRLGETIEIDEAFDIHTACAAPIS